jgi:Na+/melibiose symporter-like transporter
MAADLGYAVITSAMQLFLLFYYTDVAGINPALAGGHLPGSEFHPVLRFNP